MGCFNGTCQISQLPIHSGEKVRFLLLTKNPYTMDSYRRDGETFNPRAGTEGVYSGDFWYPELVPIRASYDDYGSVEDVDTECLNWQYWKYFLDQRIVEREKGDGSCWDYSVKKGMDLDKLLIALQNGCLLLRDDYYRQDMQLPVSQTMIREDVYQSMLGIKIQDDLNLCKPGKIGEPHTPETIFNHGMELFNSKEMDKGFLVPASKNHKEILVFSDEYNFDNKFITGLRSQEGARGIKPYRGWIVENIQSVTKEKATDLIRDISDFQYIQSMVSFLRKTWHPGTGCGSQSSNLKMVNQHSKSVAKIASELYKKHKY